MALTSTSGRAARKRRPVTASATKSLKEIASASMQSPGGPKYTGSSALQSAAGMAPESHPARTFASSHHRFGGIGHASPARGPLAGLPVIFSVTLSGM